MQVQGVGEGWESAFWLVFERSSNGIALLDDRRRFVEANDALLAIVGRSRAELVGSPATDVIPPSQQPRARREWYELLRAGDFLSAGPLVRPDGSEVEVEVAARLATVGRRQVAIYVVTSLLGPSRSVKRHAAPRGSLTRREREVVTLIALGYQTSRIAKELYISEDTVRTHVRNAMAKLGTRTRAQLVAATLSSEDAIHLARLRE